VAFITFTLLRMASVARFVGAGWDKQREVFSLLGACSIVSSVLSLIVLFLSNFQKYRQRWIFGPVLLLVFTTFLLFLLFILTGVVDYREKCFLFTPLHQRVAPLFYEISCSNNFFIVSIMVQCGFSIIYLLFSSCTLLVYLLQKENDVFGDYGPASYFKDFDPEEQAKVADQHKNLRKIKTGLWLLSIALSIASVVAICYLMFRGLGGQVDGYCPVDNNYFFPQPWKADLGCCEWRNSGSCVKPGPYCDQKPNYNSDQHNQTTMCNDLLGLVSCATFHPRAGDFIQWDKSSIQQLRICTSFCDELWYSCKYSSGSNGQYYSQYKNAYDFCTLAFPFTVVNGTQSCFNFGSHNNIPVTLIIMGGLFLYLT